MSSDNGIRLYDYAASCNCYKVRLLLSNLGVTYERVPVDTFAGETLADEYAAINPARTTPVLEMPEGYEDVEPYGANAAPGAGRSLYD